MQYFSNLLLIYYVLHFYLFSTRYNEPRFKCCKRPFVKHKCTNHKKNACTFYLKNIQTAESAHILSLALSDTSILLKHEICYVLGQMHIPESIEILKRTLANKDENEIVRHEAGEALANFLQKDIYNFQLQYTKDESPSVAETCYLAIKKFDDYNNKDSNTDYSPLSPFDSVDPAYPYTQKSIEELESLYLNSNCLYEKYKAMFALRNMKTAEAVYVLAKGFEDKSALFKHEVAFVFGQMRMKESVESMSIVLGRNEHEMVRHECAEALGAIASDEANEVLKMFLKDESRVVRESVEVALDICEYEQGNEPEYATINI